MSATRAKIISNKFHRSDYDMKVAYFLEANLSRSVRQIRAWRERLLDSPIWGTSKDWTKKNWYDTVRGHFTRAVQDLGSLERRAQYTYGKTDHEVERPNVHGRQQCFSAYGEEFCLDVQETKLSEKTDSLEIQTARSLCRIVLWYCLWDDCAMSWIVRTLGHQETICN